MKSLLVLIIITFIDFVFSYLDYTEANWPQTCTTGRRQTPIDFSKSINYRIDSNYVKLLERNYNSLSGQLSVRGEKSFGFNMTNQGTLWIEKNSIRYRYNLIDIHIHVKSEHTFNGLSTDFEMHLVHQKDMDYVRNLTRLDASDEINSLLVVGILFNATSSEDNSFIQKLGFDTLAPVSNININDLVDVKEGFYHYLGSLTTPPCDEVVNWIVLSNIQTISFAQNNVIKRWIEKYYPIGNARRTLPLNDRIVYYSPSRYFSAMSYLESSYLNVYFYLLGLVFLLL